MKKLILIVLVVLCSCKDKDKPKNCSYKDAVERGEIKDYKTSSIRINDSLTYTLDYVRDQVYKKKDPFCFGSVELNKEQFFKTSRMLIPQYNPANVRLIDMIGSGTNLCKGETMQPKDVKGYLVYYVDAEKKMFLDYINLETSKKETYPVSGVYATVRMYFLMKRSGITDKPFLIGLENKGFDHKFEDVVFLKKPEDSLYKKINKR